MNETLFYVLGVTLVVAALVVSAVGLKFESFPPSRAVMLAVIGIFIALVGATTTFAVLNAQDEQAKQEAEQAESSTESTVASSSTAGSTTTASSTEATSTTAAKGPGGTVKISADPTGQLKFEQTKLTSKPGAVKIDFTNDSPVPHDVKISDSSGTELGGTDVGTGTATATVDLAPGTYTFFCDVPGHEEAGMKGTLTVK